ncbi:patatin-like phospholipase family protein [Paracoccus sp. (in: a-proteobacteria)]|uniref:patatin-like phospholipase family protein n=1 Tax=Paracoccus sp. TaxID=267 RepID=UPI00396D014C
MDHWLCFSGGNSLGAFHAGAWAAVENARLKVTRLAGASIGSVMAALIAGNPPHRRQEALSEFLVAIAQRPFHWNSMTRRSAVAQTLLSGNPTMFTPSFPGLSEIFPAAPPDASAFLRRPMRRLLEDRIDFDRLNGGEFELTITALDAETGEVVRFRTGETRLTVDHLMASTALPVIFRPVEVEGRWFLDPGLAENLPLPALLDREDPARILAFDLYGLQGCFAPSLNSVAHRAQELMFASQSRHVLEKGDLKGRPLLHIVLRDEDDDFVGKAFDYSLQSLRHWQDIGQQITKNALDRAD